MDHSKVSRLHFDFWLWLFRFVMVLVLALNILDFSFHRHMVEREGNRGKRIVKQAKLMPTLA